MKRKILNIRIILALVLTAMMAAVPAGPALAAVVPGSVWAWGTKGATGLGDNLQMDSLVPVFVKGLSGVVDIGAGDLHSLALKSDSTVWAWGLNSYGQLGEGTRLSRYTPVEVVGLTGIKDIAAGESFSLALDKGGNVWAWGNNAHGQLADGSPSAIVTPSFRLIPAAAVGLTEITAIAAGTRHALALKSDGTVWAWGTRDFGRLGDGSNLSTVYNVPYSRSPVQVSGLTGVIAISAGGTHSLALKSDGTVWAWGNNADGQIGDASTDLQKNVPVKVYGLAGITGIAAGEFHSLAVKSDGTVWAWGKNGDGQLGIGSTSPMSRIPVQVVGLTGATSVAIATRHSLAIKSDGSVWAWGYNYYGQLGDNSTSSRVVPVQVNGLTGVTAIAARSSYSLALKTDIPTAVTGVAPIPAAPAPAPPPVAVAPPVATPAPTPAPTPVTPVLGVAPVAVVPAPVTKTPPTTTTPSTAPVPIAGQVPITKSTPRTAPTKSSSGILVYASPERIAGPAAGGVFSLSIWVAPGSRVISSGDLSLSYNATAMEIISITPGNVFGVTPMVVQNDHNNATGIARLVAARGTGSAPPPPPPPPIPATAGGDAHAAVPVGGGAAAATPMAPGPAADAAAATPVSPDGPFTDPILAAIIAAADAEAARIMADLNAALNTAANAAAGVLGIQSPAATVADADAPTHHAAEAVPNSPATATGVGATPNGGAVPPPTGKAYYGNTTGGGAAAGPPSGNAYFGSPETGFVASYSLAVIRFKVKPQVKPGDYQVSISKVGLADAKGQDIQVRLITGSTITIGGPMKMGDLTGDGVVDYRDLGIFASSYGSSSGQKDFNYGADMNGDAVIDYRDLAIFGANYGK